MDPISAYITQQQLDAALTACSSALNQVRAIDLSSQLTAAAHGVNELLAQIHLNVAQAHAEIMAATSAITGMTGGNPALTLLR